MSKPMVKTRVDLDLALANRVSVNQTFRGVRAATLEGERIVKDVLSQPGTGATYRRGGITHQASAPGESPATDRGTLRNSVSSEVMKHATGAEGQVIVSAEHAAPLELGTERIQPRPFISRLLSEFAPRLLGAFAAGSKRGR